MLKMKVSKPYGASVLDCITFVTVFGTCIYTGSLHWYHPFHYFRYIPNGTSSSSLLLFLLLLLLLLLAISGSRSKSSILFCHNTIITILIQCYSFIKQSRLWLNICPIYEAQEGQSGRCWVTESWLLGERTRGESAEVAGVEGKIKLLSKSFRKTWFMWPMLFDVICSSLFIVIASFKICNLSWLISSLNLGHLTHLPLMQHIQYIPRNMHTVLLCFVLLWLRNRS